jgi:hypothetical protein
VKRLSADDSADTRVKVGHRQTPLKNPKHRVLGVSCIGWLKPFANARLQYGSLPHVRDERLPMRYAMCASIARCTHDNLHFLLLPDSLQSFTFPS